MKKYLFILLLIVSAGILLAVESAPSETVGYYKKTVGAGNWDVFSLPFGYASMNPNDILGYQFDENDVILDVTSGDIWTYYGAEFGWWPSGVENLTYGHAYWLNRAGSTPLDYYIMGTVNPQVVNYTVPANGWACFSMNECRDIDPNSLPMTGLQENDLIMDIITGDLWTYYGSEFGWWPSGDTMLHPTHGYYIYTSGSGFNWTYTPPARSIVSQPATGNYKTTAPGIKKK